MLVSGHSSYPPGCHVPSRCVSTVQGVSVRGSFRFLLLIVALVAGLVPGRAAAQTLQRGKLTVTVADPSGAFVPGASVTLVGLDTATKAVTLPAATTTDKGVAVFESIAVGRYSIRAEFAGFEMGLLRDFRVNTG